jgi:two-component system chemotaxis response regulator CheY
LRCVRKGNYVTAVLVIDDDPEIRAYVREILEAEGLEIREAKNGDAGIKAHRKSPADLILCDIFMPDKEGLETVRELHREFPSLKIVAMSGDSPWETSFNFLAMAKAFGAAATIEKPFTPKALVSTIQGVLES